uniref:Uncharacterized protein n=1 Tax=Steinernema glaseri TaxID=37863 RepID=A0A1I8AL53_9BILA
MLLRRSVCLPLPASHCTTSPPNVSLEVPTFPLGAASSRAPNEFAAICLLLVSGSKLPARPLLPRPAGSVVVATASLTRCLCKLAPARARTFFRPILAPAVRGEPPPLACLEGAVSPPATIDAIELGGDLLADKDRRRGR